MNDYQADPATMNKWNEFFIFIDQCDDADSLLILLNETLHGDISNVDADYLSIKATEQIKLQVAIGFYLSY